VGDREMEQESVAVRTRKGEDLGTMKIEGLAERAADEVKRRL